MSEINTILLVLFIGFISGFFDSLIGSGGLISIPSLIFLGLPPQVAIATDRLGMLGQLITAFIKFWKAKKIVWKYVLPLSLVSLIGSIVGAKILLQIDPKILNPIVAILILLLLPLIFLKKKTGLEKIKTSKFKQISGLTIFFLIAVFAGFFGQGSGVMIFYTLTFFLGLTMIEVLATDIIPWFVIAISSSVVFAINGLINYKIAIILFVGMAIGGYIGAHLAIKKGNLWIRYLFIAFVIILGIKLLFF